MLNKKVYAVIALLGAGILLAIWGAAKETALVEGLGFLLIVGGLAAHVALIRCPFCGGYLGRYFGLGMHCPHCGKKIE